MAATSAATTTMVFFVVSLNPLNQFDNSIILLVIAPIIGPKILPISKPMPSSADFALSTAPFKVLSIIAAIALAAPSLLFNSWVILESCSLLLAIIADAAAALTPNISVATFNGS